MTNINEAVTVTNNRAQYFADLAKQYRDEAKEHRDNAKQYAEKNSDVTLDYVETMRATLDRKINSCVFQNDLPTVSELVNDACYVNSDELDNTKEELNKICENRIESETTIINTELNKKLNNFQITNCILEAPNGIATLSDLTITTKQGLKFLMPNGRNADGTLNNIERTVKQDANRTIENTEGSYFMFWFENLGLISSWGGKYVISEKPPTVTTGQYIMWYNPATNLYKRSDNGGDYYTTQVVYMGVLRKDGGQPITIFEPVQPFRAVDYSEYLVPPRVIETYVNGYSGYRIWSPDQTGRQRCQQWGSIRDTSSGTKVVTFLKPFADTYYTILRNCGSNWTGGGIASYQNCYYLTTTSFTTAHATDNDQLNSNRWYADGYIN